MEPGDAFGHSVAAPPDAHPAGSDAMSNRAIIGLIALAVVVFLATQTFYTVNPTIQVLVRQFGAIVGERARWAVRFWK